MTTFWASSHQVKFPGAVVGNTWGTVISYS